MLQNVSSAAVVIGALRGFFLLLFFIICASVLIAYAQKPALTNNAGVSNGARGLSLPLLPFFEYARSDCSGETAHTRRLG